jgi:hypothetical protein
MLPSTAGSFPARPRVLGRGSAQSRVQDVAACGPGSWPLGPLQRSGVVVVARQSCWRCVELGCPAVRCRDHVDVAVSPLLSQPVGIHHTMQGRGWIAVSVEGAVHTKMGAAGVAAETVALHESSAQEGRMHPCADLCTYVGVCGGGLRCQSLCAGFLLCPPTPLQERALCWPLSGVMLL